MDLVEFTRALALIDKLLIENHPNLTREEKEFLKKWIDSCKEGVERESIRRKNILQNLIDSKEDNNGDEQQ